MENLDYDLLEKHAEDAKDSMFSVCEMLFGNLDLAELAKQIEPGVRNLLGSELYDTMIFYVRFKSFLDANGKLLAEHNEADMIVKAEELFCLMKKQWEQIDSEEFFTGVHHWTFFPSRFRQACKNYCALKDQLEDILKDRQLASIN